jgi:GMP synthase (glutamine-hydrolysing)
LKEEGVMKTALILKHIENEGPGLIGGLFTADEWKTSVIELWKGEELPSDFDEISCVVVMGGPMNVYEEESYPFLKAEDAFIRNAVERGIPFLGICLGAQLLAKAFAAQVWKAPEREIGWRKVALTESARDDALFQGVADPIVFQWHEDTFDLPDNAVLLAEGEICRNQAFRIGRWAYGLQFHIEASGDMVMDWISGEQGIDGAAIQAECTILSHRIEAQAERILSNCRQLIQEWESTRRDAGE